MLWAGGASLSLISLQLLVDVLGISETLRQALFLASLIPFAFVPFAFLSACSAAAFRAPRRWAT